MRLHVRASLPRQPDRLPAAAVRVHQLDRFGADPDDPVAALDDIAFAPVIDVPPVAQDRELPLPPAASTMPMNFSGIGGGGGGAGGARPGDGAARRRAACRARRPPAAGRGFGSEPERVPRRLPGSGRGSSSASMSTLTTPSRRRPAPGAPRCSRRRAAAATAAAAGRRRRRGQHQTAASTASSRQRPRRARRRLLGPSVPAR